MLCSTSSGCMAYHICVLVSVVDRLAFLGFLLQYRPSKIFALEFGTKAQLIMWNFLFATVPSVILS